MTPEDFQFVSALVKETSGLTLTDDKAYLVENRLLPIVRRRELGGLEDLVGMVRRDHDKVIIKEITEAMTTNESFFFRDIRPFDILRDDILPAMVAARGGRKIRIWCAAASTGQEPYSIAIIVREEAAKHNGTMFDIVGTDISTEVLARAKKGVYTQFEVQRGLPIQHLVRYFKQDGNSYQLDDSIRSMVDYKEYNLLGDLKGLGTFDIVFCRNVLIYFDPETKAQVLERIAQQMPSDGLLFLGGAETVVGVTGKFKPVQGKRGVYAVQ